MVGLGFFLSSSGALAQMLAAADQVRAIRVRGEAITAVATIALSTVWDFCWTRRTATTG
jgi:hypothetical protein